MVEKKPKCIICNKSQSEEHAPFCKTCHAKVHHRGSKKWMKEKLKTK